MFRLPALRSAFRKTAATATTPTPFRSFSASAAREFARLTIVGRLGAKPELASTRAGTEYVKFNVASSTGSAENRKTSWFKISSFRQNKDYLLGLEKGSVAIVLFLFFSFLAEMQALPILISFCVCFRIQISHDSRMQR